MSRPELPLLGLAAGALVAAAAAAGVEVPPPAAAPVALAATAILAAFRCREASPAWWWALVGLALAAGPALTARARLLEARSLLHGEAPAVRIEVRVMEGWRPVRWGLVAPVRVLTAHRRGQRVPLPAAARLEVRNAGRAATLPRPGARVRALARVASPPAPGRPLRLVVASPRLLHLVRAARGLPAVRERGVAALLAAAGTNARRIRGAELAAALALGRRDLLPPTRVARWRESGLAHALAVSGLHVGIAGGLAWAAAALAGAPAGRSRAVAAAVVTAYAALAGASPSATRAAAMAVAYVAARAVGRALLPLGAVALVALATVLAAPASVTVPAVQLTFWITAALLRWTPPLAERLPLPPWLAWPVAVPLVAQAAAAPLIALHFGALRPGAAVVNLLAAPVLPVLLAVALAATALAPAVPALAAGLLGTLEAGERLLLATGGLARATAVTVPPPPAWLVIVGALALAVSLTPGRWGRWGLAATVAAGLAWAAWPAATVADGVRTLAVHRGAAVLLRSGNTSVLVDGGASRTGAVRELATLGVHRLAAVVATHPDADHVGGLPRAIRALRPGVVVVPRWALGRRETVPLLRAARTTGATVIPMRRGLSLRLPGLVLEAVWPPARPPRDDNDASLVLRARLPDGVVLLPGDAGRRAERELLRLGVPGADVLVLAHHGSRTASGPAFLAAVGPRVALVPAGHADPRHPHPETVTRLHRLGIPWCAARDPWPCGASREDGRWQLLR